MESFTIELVSNASAHLIRDNTLSSFTNFLSEQLNLDGQLVNGRLQFQKYPTHQCTKMLRRENLRFLTGDSQSHQISIT